MKVNLLHKIKKSEEHAKEAIVTKQGKGFFHSRLAEQLPGVDEHIADKNHNKHYYNADYKSQCIKLLSEQVITEYCRECHCNAAEI